MNLARLFLRHPRYLAFAAAAGAAAFIAIALIPQLPLLWSVAHGATLGDLFAVAAALMWGAVAESGTASAMPLAISVLFGLTVAGTGYYLRVYRAAAISSVAVLSAGGTASGLLALTCLSCGSIIAALLSSVFSASSVLIFSAYQSALFGAVSIGLLLLSLAILNRRLAEAVGAGL